MSITSADIARVSRVTLPYPPSVNRYWRQWQGRTLLSAEARKYKNAAAIIARAAGMRPISGPVVLSIDFYRPRKRGDCDNLFKAQLDSLRGIAYADDDQVVEIHARRFDDKSNPRAEVTVTQAEMAQEAA